MIKKYLHAGITYVRLLFIKWFGNLEFFSYTPRNHFGKHVTLVFDKGSNISFGRDVGLRDNVTLSARNGATIKLGDGVFLNNGCQVIAHHSIILEDNVKCGQNTMFFDHDYDYLKKDGLKNKVFKTGEIHIGKNTWIGAGSIILRGTTIGDNCIIGAGSIVKGNIPSNHMYVQKREHSITEILIDQ